MPSDETKEKDAQAVDVEAEDGGAGDEDGNRSSGGGGVYSTNAMSTLTSPKIRIGTWNVLLQEDEFNEDYGCPLSIATCYTNSSSSDDDNDKARNECTRDRQRRVWRAIEDRAVELDVLCLQEIHDDFLAIQSVAYVSNWTMVARSGECALFVSSLSANVEVVTTYAIELPSLSGCPSVPMAIVQAHDKDIDTSTNSSAATMYIVGSVHVKASVTDMKAWFNASAELIYNATSSVLSNTSMTTLPSSNIYNATFVLAGDFNHNLTDHTESGALPKHWEVVYATNNANFSYGTSQKEYNWMGSFDGFWISSPFSFNESTGHLVFASPTNASSSNTENSTSKSVAVSNVMALIDGFMPKVVYNLPQNGGVVPSQAQFAVLSRLEGFDQGPVSAERIQQWNELDDNDLQVVFSADSNHSSIYMVLLPNSNPRTEAMSDHMLVTATFAMSEPSIVATTNNTKRIVPLDQSSSASRNVSWWAISLACVAGLALLFVVVKLMRRKPASRERHPRYGGIPGSARLS